MTFPVDWEDLIGDDQEARTQSLYNRGGDVYLIAHHSVTTTVQQTIATFKSPARTVSANFAFGPIVAGSEDVKVVRTVAEARRAYTTSSAYDDRALTVEISNMSLGGSYPVAQKAKQRLAELAAYMHMEFGMPLDRWHVCTHQEVYERGWGSYATACPGPDLQTSMDEVVALANRIVAGSATTQQKESRMLIIQGDQTGAGYQFLYDPLLDIRSARLNTRQISLGGYAGVPTITMQQSSLDGIPYGLEAAIKEPTSNTQPIVDAVNAAITAALKNVAVNVPTDAIAAASAKATDLLLASKFAQVNANIDDQPTKFDITPKA